MESIREITFDKKEDEFQRVVETFQPIKLFTYMEKGEVMVFVNRT